MGWAGSEKRLHGLQHRANSLYAYLYVAMTSPRSSLHDAGICCKARCLRMLRCYNDGVWRASLLGRLGGTRNARRGFWGDLSGALLN